MGKDCVDAASDSRPDSCRGARKSLLGRLSTAATAQGLLQNMAGAVGASDQGSHSEEDVRADSRGAMGANDEGSPSEEDVQQGTCMQIAIRGGSAMREGGRGERV